MVLGSMVGNWPVLSLVRQLTLLDDLSLLNRCRCPLFNTGLLILLQTLQKDFL